MPGIMVPKSRAEQPTQGGGRDFPEGDWILTIEETRVRPFPDFIDPISRPKAGYASKDGEVLSLQLGSATAVQEGQDDPGAQKHFVDFVIRDGGVTVEDGLAIPEKSWQMERAATMLTNLALALGATEEVTDENGEEFVVTAENFLSELMAGGFNGAKVGASVYHRKYKKRDGGDGVEVKTREFFAAV